MGFIQRIKRAHQAGKLAAENRLYCKRLLEAGMLLAKMHGDKDNLPAEMRDGLPELIELYNEMCVVLRHRQNQMLELKKG